MRYEWVRAAFSGVLSALLMVQGAIGAEPQEPGVPSKPTLKIAVVSGQNAANSLRAKIANPLVVEVRDATDRPVPGAVVHFSIPFDGPGLTFANGSRAITAVTETDGRAVVDGLTPVGAGVFQITVEASAGGEFTTAIITQANSENGGIRPGMAGSQALASQAGSGKHTSKGVIIGIVAGVAVAAAAGLAIGLRNSKHSSSSSSGIGVGTPTVGAP